MTILTNLEREALIESIALYYAEGYCGGSRDDFEADTGWSTTDLDLMVHILRREQLVNLDGQVWGWTPIEAMPDDKLLCFYLEWFEEYVAEALSGDQREGMDPTIALADRIAAGKVLLVTFGAAIGLGAA